MIAVIKYGKGFKGILQYAMGKPGAYYNGTQRLDHCLRMKRAPENHQDAVRTARGRPRTEGIMVPIDWTTD